MKRVLDQYESLGLIYVSTNPSTEGEMVNAVYSDKSNCFYERKDVEEEEEIERRT